MKGWALEVNPHAKVCEKFRKALDVEEDDTFITFLAMEGYPTSYYIRGSPSYADDGDGHFDDMTETEEISYCPFCGEKL